MQSKRGGCSANPLEALKCFKKASELGHVESFFLTATIYHFGKGVPVDKNEAIKYYKRGALKGDAQAMTNLGGMHFYGDGVKKDSREAAKLWSAAAETAYEEAQLNLANLLNVGAEGILIDKSLSFKWYKKAAESG